ncbi:non-ribosomal peptide synthetase [Thermoflavimicrobium daqui]|uniref:Non-ribosomal peptide synthetase n=2 Tax=Thermoflavimicrobium daqui TaxID=2137476 RepID=A0A364K5G4_9BACL|nr:non-ribosomal peptide synthetase [Thermoflavimicrobium daqui]
MLEWNCTDVDLPQICLHQLFERQAQQTPDLEAVVIGNELITYQELNKRANQIAHFLVEMGVKPNTPVGLFMERSIDMVVVLVGVLKSGGAYLPIDPEVPKERVHQILQEAKSPLCICNNDLQELRHSELTSFVILEEVKDIISLLPEHNLDVNVTPDDMVSVYYTSGTTGTPKCVANIHRGYVNKMLAMQRAYQLKIGETLLQKASIAFDDSSVEIFWPLISGGRVALMEPGLHRDPRAIVEALIHYKVTYMYVVSSMLSRILEEIREDERDSFIGLKGVFAGADPLTSDIVDRFFKKLPGKLYNTWGSTEVSIDATIHTCTLDDLHEDGVICIGKPFDNVYVYILDEKMHPVPVGEVGDLYVAGVGVSRGYLNQSKRNAKVFLQNPFQEGTMYKTGDKGYYRPDGSIMFLGRVDNQVKIRGIRIELEEIEKVLRKEQKVKEAIVLLREEIPGIKRLVAYVVLHGGEELTISQLKAGMKNYLPQYMMPHFIIFLDKMPLNQNNKINKKALPAPSAIRPNVESEYVAPSSELEEWLTGIFAEVLHIEKVGIKDDFFELGGDSISATQVMTRIRAFLDQDAPLKLLFEHKTVAELASYFHDYEPANEVKTIQQIPRNREAFPASFAQERLWIMQELDKNQPVYNEPIAFRIKGHLNSTALIHALQKIVERHETLRTSFKMEDEQLTQVIVDELKLDIPVYDLTTMPTEERKDYAHKVMYGDARKPFELQTAPLFRAMLFKLKDEEWFLYMNMHHIITDAWSFLVLLKELNILYDAFQNDKLCPLEPLSFQYLDFSSRQRNWLERGEITRQLDFWKADLEGMPTVLQLPTDYPRPAVLTYDGDKLYFSIDSSLVKRIRELAKSSHASEYMVFLSAFNLLLHRYSGQKEILIGSPTANRNQHGLEHLIGFFVNTLVIKSIYKPGTSFFDYFNEVKERCFTIFHHQDVPFERLVSELQPERNMDYSPLVQVMFAFQNKMEESLELPGLNVELINLNNHTAKYDMTMFLTENSREEYQGVLEFNSNLFKKSTIERLVENFVTLLEQVVLDSKKELAAYSIVSGAELAQIMKLNDTDHEFEMCCLHELFERQAQLTPDHTAVVFGDESLTYRELDVLSNQLAHYLISEKGIGPDQIISICIERSIEIVVGLLGILKAGGAFLPLDTESPPERWRQIIMNSGSKLCLTQLSLSQSLPNDMMDVVVLELNHKDIFATASKDKPMVHVTPEHLVSVYYTSGSTGVPKGVANLHKGWVNRMIWMQRYFKLKPGETVLQKTTLTFDDAAVEFFWPLMVGGRIALMKPNLHRDPRAILDDAIQYQAVHLQFVPSMLNMVLDEITPEDIKKLSSLRSCISSGEALSPKTVNRFFETMPGTLNNTWGATEVSIDSTIHTCTIEDTKDTGPVCVGKPIDNNYVYILDEHLQPVPIGVVGDLYLAGVGLAREYLNDSEKTDRAFISNPFTSGERMYKTGDRGYFREDGSIKFIGRADNQVKIRGMRVELGEIENVLQKHPLVKDVVVVIKKETDDLKRLIAFIIPSDPEGIREDKEIRNYLKSKLPEYMVPSFLFYLEQFPLNSNGKVDRNQLLQQDLVFHLDHESYVAPQSMAEIALAEIWMDLLKLNRVGVLDRFFELGGHSLLATQVLSRIRRRFGVEIPLQEIFLKETIQELALELEEQLIRKIENMSDEEASMLLEQLDESSIS